MFLELATTSGAILGAAVAAYVNSTMLELIFGSVLLISLVPLVMKIGEDIPAKPELRGLAKRLSLKGSYTDAGKEVSYNATRPGLGLAGMLLAGLISGMLGIGSGTFKVSLSLTKLMTKSSSLKPATSCCSIATI